MTRTVYLDANASEPLRPEARAAALAAMEAAGNPSSVHAAGRAARRVLEDAREAVAARFGAAPANVVFTSGGTEADALAIHALRAVLGPGARTIAGATEHDAVRAAAPDAAVLPVDADGIADLDALDSMLAGDGPALVCLMLANNETGAIQPVAAAAEICRRHGARLHVDAVQAAGRIPVDAAALGADTLALSSHKLGGPLGAGALLLAPHLSHIAPLIAGGGQERGRRGGTPPLPAIAGFGAAAALPRADQGRLAALRDAIERAAVAAGAVAIGAGASRLANTACLALPGVRADAQVIALDLAGFAVSAGAACSSGKVAASHVLAAMGLGDLAGQAIRVSLPWNAREEDAAAFGAAYAAMAERLRSPAAALAAARG
ncbi:MAG: aminotransferase class V-fold PLP-dependent enzyme [Proteobacteria bacterium]|nr:aminotransferase class V-fold PLP-dependent enzyme [Pseudomonadota bacterium]